MQICKGKIQVNKIRDLSDSSILIASHIKQQGIEKKTVNNQWNAVIRSSLENHVRMSVCVMRICFKGSTSILVYK